MATDTSIENSASGVALIGETAGQLWHILESRGSLTIAKLVKEVAVPRDVVMQALGWLAREDKIAIDEDSRTRVVSLRL